ncbi:MAG: Lrp/AsnC ligand binding domain-containing protein [Bacteroidales bacterium]|jgi:Lrp/AsnC family transcriptional regulator for asnA, asnC and gidA|nr:Lrp/AsnC ligand binding domain-containing protein [Bacteroidales bacterium]
MEDVLDELDYKILRLISNDARVSFLEVSRICNVSGAAVHQRVQKMMANGIITGSEFWLDLQKIGYQTCTFLLLRFGGTENLDVVVEKLKEIREIVECHAIVGEYDILIKIFAKNNNHLYEIIQSQIKPLGVVRTETVISYQESFHRQFVFE